MQTLFPARNDARTEAVCLICGQLKKQRTWTAGRFVNLLLALLLVGYAAYSTLQQRMITIQEIMHGARTGYHWIIRRDEHDAVIQKEFKDVKEQLAAARRNEKATLDRLSAMERALRVCSSQPRPARRVPNTEAGWPPWGMPQ